MLVIPTQSVPNQTLQVQLGGQACTIDIAQTRYGMFVNVYVDTVLMAGGVIALNLHKIVRDAYLGFVGDLAFVDMQGKTDPVYTGLGSRYQLLYLEASDL